MMDLEQVGAVFAQELTRALGERAGEQISIERLVLDAPLAELSRPGGLREIAQATARRLRERAGRE